jgi:hypothetical protein
MHFRNGRQASRGTDAGLASRQFAQGALRIRKNVSANQKVQLIFDLKQV